MTHDEPLPPAVLGQRAHQQFRLALTAAKISREIDVAEWYLDGSGHGLPGLGTRRYVATIGIMSGDLKTKRL